LSGFQEQKKKNRSRNKENTIGEEVSEKGGGILLKKRCRWQKAIHTFYSVQQKCQEKQVIPGQRARSEEERVKKVTLKGGASVRCRLKHR